MKKIYKQMGLAAASLLLLNSCDMDRYPLTSFSEDTFYDDEANVELALTGLYRGGITLGVDYNVSDWWAYSATILLDGVSDIGYDRRGFTNALGQLTSGTITETNLWVQNLYQKPYRRISACCRFLDGLNAIAEKTDEMERMEAEARFIRAVQYFYLASYYHDVPLVTKTLSLDEANSVKKSSRMEVLQYAADELKDVANILPRQKDLPKNELGRATAQAALVYLARTYLIMEDFENAAIACGQIIEWGDNQIDPDYQGLFYQTGEESSEHIFATQFVDDLAGHGLPQHAYPIKDGGWCLVNISNALFEAYDFVDGTPFSYEDPRFDKNNFGANRDPRLDYTLYYDGATFKGTVYNCNPEATVADKIGPGQTTQTGYLLRKYLDETWSGDINSCGTNVPLARYADVLLMYLEAKVRGGSTITQTLLDQTINEVRGRSSVNMPPLTEKDPQKLFELIQKERMIELAFEGWRLWDLFRWGIAEEKLNEPIYGSPFYVSDQSLMQMKDGQPDLYSRWYVNTRSFVRGQEVWPIPLAEKNINPNLR
ncbi:RagB/SusD family nutrient uptake outer membrane protein [Caecibacteroides pullorum]|uniref:RagB/SusD family nutrient uptake outer membrane protein n=1 Tax=Caecibacteroides pullorum TaxID=2725562 RepID=A0AA41D8G1_9BACT|nr:RagB/SusD family nutrient uptake outer membrane protein [Caecibacteroides pullorum]MBM6857251.1 RagB/SusD family nutrient uptake outer membrane protein [Caecibacteroides pullorum]MBV8040598.1 RagB/SusD family nutrient uptake outer membrane protein [Caecibacteroides pullorum]MBV8058255.1 RagB/SusD family nutrient uptake outer membrane protein [Caecibacteroides pullorum]MDC6281390.1 RagB/SusD family nutrient uptake outer membrane protein [Caecibacteroides pullorum]